MGLIEDIKNQVKKSGSNKGKILYFKPGVKVRVRFLQEMDEGMKVLFHDSFEAGINAPCQEVYDRECEYHEDETLRHRENYIWSTWDHEAKEVKLLMGAVNNFSPIPALVGFYETYGTITDRDYVITKTGSGTNQTWSIVPMDKARFRNEKAKPYSESKVLQILDKAFPCEGSDKDEEEEPKKKPRKVARRDEEEDEDDVPQRRKKARVVEEDEDDEEPVPKKRKKPVVEDDEDEEEEPAPKKKKAKKVSDYDDMTAKELYLECKERGINVKPKMDEDYYISKLEASDEDGDDEAW